MSHFYMNFTLVEEKLHWAFKLYDKDGNGEIDLQEMEDIFIKLCALVTKEKKKNAATKEKDNRNLLLATKLKLQKEETQFTFLSTKLQKRKKLKENKSVSTGRAVRRNSVICAGSGGGRLQAGEAGEEDCYSECSSEQSGRSGRSAR